jgi:hypothetical protein
MRRFALAALMATALFLRGCTPIPCFADDAAKPALTPAQALERLRADDAGVVARQKEMQALIFEFRFAECERDWHQTPLWKRLAKYHAKDPCWAVVRRAEKVPKGVAP